jgi:hypothetical protein
MRAMAADAIYYRKGKGSAFNGGSLGDTISTSAAAFK